MFPMRQFRFAIKLPETDIVNVVTFQIPTLRVGAASMLMPTVSSSETSVNFYRTLHRNNPENSQLHRKLCSLSTISFTAWGLGTGRRDNTDENFKERGCGMGSSGS
jgi:hypothetical protein